MKLTPLLGMLTVVVAGCSVQTVAPIEDACPAKRPAEGAACQGNSQCLYDTAGNLYSGQFDCHQQEIACRDGQYRNSGLHCDPPPPREGECPFVRPAFATPCVGNQQCFYDSENRLYTGVPDCQHPGFACREGQFRELTMDCDPPPPPVDVTCPATAPVVDAACQGTLNCAYDEANRRLPDNALCNQPAFSCQSGRWSKAMVPCVPTTPTADGCPYVRPAEGDPCNVDHTCLYDLTGALREGPYLCGGQELACRDGEFHNTGLHCDPPTAVENECPAIWPAPGSLCQGTQRCLYDADGKLYVGQFNCYQRELVCTDNRYQDTGLHCDPRM